MQIYLSPPFKAMSYVSVIVLCLCGCGFPTSAKCTHVSVIACRMLFYCDHGGTTNEHNSSQDCMCKMLPYVHNGTLESYTIGRYLKL